MSKKPHLRNLDITSGDIHNIDPLPVTAYATAYPTGHSVMFIPANHEYSVGWRESLGLGTSINWYFIVEYFKTTHNNGYQKVTAYRLGSNLPNAIFMRNSTGSTSWNNWKRIFTSDDITDSTTTDDSTKVVSAKAVKTVNDNLTQLQQTVNEHSAETVQDGVHGLASTQNITYYVDAVNGNDANDGLTSSTAFKTIQKAIDSLPQIINHIVTINVAPGTYDEDVKIRGFFGKSEIYIYGATTLENSVNFKVKSIEIKNCTVHLIVQGMNITTTAAVPINIGYCISVILKYFTIDGVNTTNGHGVYVNRSTHVDISDSSISNKWRAIGCQSSRVHTSNNTGSGNTIGLYAMGAGVIGKNGTQPSGTTAELAATGGVIR